MGSSFNSHGKDTVNYFEWHRRYNRGGGGTSEPPPEFHPPPPEAPTQHMAGSVEKIEVIVQRIESGRDLWHPEDNPINHLGRKDGFLTR